MTLTRQSERSSLRLLGTAISALLLAGERFDDPRLDLP